MIVSFFNRYYFIVSSFLLCSCTNYGQLEVIADLPGSLHENSGIQLIHNSNLLWALNDGGNKNRIYGINTKGEIKKVVTINAKNNDWEDLTSDPKGNLYIGDFGNNDNNRKNLAVLKVDTNDLKNKKNADVERIQFYFPFQKKFPPKNKQLYFDTESFFFFNDSLYLFTKSRVKGDFGKTSLYKIPATEGNHAAEFISDYSSCKKSKCSITSAAMSKDQKKVVLLSSESILLLTDFEDDNFFNGKIIKLPLGHKSQKEGVCFKNNKNLYITDERSHGSGGNLYEFKI
jgi:hypothetical protein